MMHAGKWFYIYMSCIYICRLYIYVVVLEEGHENDVYREMVLYIYVVYINMSSIYICRDFGGGS